MEGGGWRHLHLHEARIAALAVDEGEVDNGEGEVGQEGDEVDLRVQKVIGDDRVGGIGGRVEGEGEGGGRDEAMELERLWGGGGNDFKAKLDEPSEKSEVGLGR